MTGAGRAYDTPFSPRCRFRRRKVRSVRNAQAWAFLTRSLAPPLQTAPAALGCGLAGRTALIAVVISKYAPGLCGPWGWLPQLVGTRRASETAQSPQVFSARGPKARRRGGGHPEMRAGLDHKSSGMRSSVMGSGGHGLADLGGAQRNRSPLGRGPRRSFGFFPIAWKETRPAGRNIPLPPPRGKKTQR